VSTEENNRTIIKDATASERSTRGRGASERKRERFSSGDRVLSIEDLISDYDSRQGGDLCITPPSNSHNDNQEQDQPSDYSILCSGIDTLVLTFYVTWKDESIFDYLENLKKNAQILGEELEGKLGNEGFEDIWMFKIQTHGSRGYAYILKANDYTLKLARKQNLGTMPNAVVEIRSETLWTLGEKEAVKRITQLINQYATSIDKIKPSRVDLCVDLELPEEEWTTKILDNKVTRAPTVKTFEEYDKITGIQIGSGDLFVRIYDKILEIRKISKKTWMYAVWGIDKVKEEKKVIRVEFQIRRPVLMTLGVNEIEDLYREMNSIWAYLTQEWVKFLERKEKNKERQKALPWWYAVQCGYKGICEPSKRVRPVAIRMQQEQIAKRILTGLENLMASVIAARRLEIDSDWTLNHCWIEFGWRLLQMGINDIQISNNIKKKVVNYQRQDNETVPF
jgi:hypothetical protein